MRAQEAQYFFDYNCWANTRILDAVERLPPALYSSPAPLTFGSLHGTLLHVLVAEQVWRSRVRDGISLPKLLDKNDVPDLETLKTRLAEEERMWRGFLSDIADDRMAADVAYRTTEGKDFRTPLWQIVLHVVNHGTQFRGEAAAFLTQEGSSPGDLDFIHYVRAVAPR
jgi:uncharacterized damage-inducible protein DinB